MSFIELFNRLNILKTDLWTNITKQHMIKHTEIA